MASITVAIIGMGPRGMGVLERLFEHAALLDADAHLTVELFDCGNPGEGAHKSVQPSDLLVNTVSSQITMFEPESKMETLCGKSFIEWAIDEGYRYHKGAIVGPDAKDGEILNNGHHLPRRLLGEYLTWFYNVLLSAIPNNITVRHNRTIVNDVCKRESRYIVKTEKNIQFDVDYVIIATGHGRRVQSPDDKHFSAFCSEHRKFNSRISYFQSPYPIESLKAVEPGAVVAVQGFGLTAYDVISALTIGRGGRYVEHDGRLSYQPSGLEPHLSLFSRSGLPFAARGINQKGLTGRHHCKFFTPEFVARERVAAIAKGGDGRLNFAEILLPVLIKEMAFAARLIDLREKLDPGDFNPSDYELEFIKNILWPSNSDGFETHFEATEYFYKLVHDDLNEALLGNRTSRVKAATDVLRDAREAFRSAIEFGGLDTESHKYFHEVFNGIINRVAFGPPLRRNQELLALHEIGLVDLAGGPGSRVITSENDNSFVIETKYRCGSYKSRADVLISARLDFYSPLFDSSMITKNLVDRGYITPFTNGGYHPCGINISKDLHPIARDGTPQQRMWVIGYPVEGAHYYTHALPRPAIKSRHVRDAETCVLRLYADASKLSNPSAGLVFKTGDEVGAHDHSQEIFA